MNTVSQCPIFQAFIPIFYENGWKRVQKFCFLTLGNFFESKDGESNEPGVKMTNFPKICWHIFFDFD